MTVSSTPAGPSSTDTTSEDDAFLNSVEGEISFFRSIMRARPVGIHRFFHILVVRNAIFKDTGRAVNVDSLWRKLRTYYNLDALEAADTEHENSFIPSKNAPPVPIPSPSPTDNLGDHPFFRFEFQLPYDDDIELLISERRMRATASAPSTPAASPMPAPAPTKRQKGSKKQRGKSQSKMAGLVGGDSDSSALTQESGDEGMPATPRESVVTGTDAGTESGDEEDVEMQDTTSAPPHRSTSPKPTRGRPPKASARGKKGASRGAASTRAAAKKRKR